MIGALPRWTACLLPLALIYSCPLGAAGEPDRPVANTKGVTRVGNSTTGNAVAPAAQPGSVTADTMLTAALNLEAPGMETVRAALRVGDPAALQSAYLQYRRTASHFRWDVQPSDQPRTPVASTDARGDAVCSHHITDYWYGHPYKDVDMGADFDWTHNPVPKSDPSSTDEWTYCVISRTQFWRLLADAYWKTRNEKYAAAWVAQLRDFAAKNPLPANNEGMFNNPPSGQPSLWRTLDAATRMCESWPYAYVHFLNSPSFTPDAHWLFLKLVYEHAHWLQTGLQDLNRTGNWVTNECYGLYTIGALFPELREAAEWRQFAVDRMTLELNRIVPPDGLEAELTPGYHANTAKHFQQVLALAKRNGLPVPEAFQDRILSMYRALVLVMDQSGHAILTNDSWPTNAMDLARDGLAVGDDPLLKWAASHGKEGSAPPASTMLPYAGFYAMRGGWDPDDLFLFFRGGPTGIGHEHEDMLEVVLRAWNKTLLPDTGSYSYDSSVWRRYTIGTASHNTVIVDGKWQHRGSNQPPVTRKVSNPWVTTPLFDYVAATYDGGYQQSTYVPRRYYPQHWEGTPDKSVTHTRSVFFLRPHYALVLDTLDGTGRHTFDALYHLDAPAAQIDPATQAAFSQRTDNVQLALYPLEREHLAVDIIQGQKEPLLGWIPGEHRPIPTVRFRKEQDAPAIFATILYPYQGTAPAFSANPLAVKGDGVWGQTLNTAEENAEVALVKAGTPRAFTIQSRLLGAVQVKAAGWVTRQKTGEKQITAGGWGVQSYRSNNFSFTLAQPGVILFRVSGADLEVFNGGDAPAALSFTHPFAHTETIAPGVWQKIQGN